MSPGRILLLIAVICFVIAAISAAGTRVLIGADVWGFVGLAFFAAAGLV